MYPAKKEKIIHEKLIEFIKNNSKGLTMTELVKRTGFSRKAIEKHLQILKLICRMNSNWNTVKVCL